MDANLQVYESESRSTQEAKPSTGPTCSECGKPVFVVDFKGNVLRDTKLRPDRGGCDCAPRSERPVAAQQLSQEVRQTMALEGILSCLKAFMASQNIEVAAPATAKPPAVVPKTGTPVDAIREQKQKIG